MSDENSTEIDLFGNEVYVIKRTRGRPKFVWTKENSLKVSMLLAMGWNNDRIATTVLDPRTGKSISVPTLKRHFRSELSARDTARDQLTARQFMLAYGAAESGNVGAMRLFDQLKEKNDLMLLAGQMPTGSGKDEKGKRPVEGKKAAADRSAKEVVDGGDDDGWGADLKPGVYN